MTQYPALNVRTSPYLLDAIYVAAATDGSYAWRMETLRQFHGIRPVHLFAFESVADKDLDTQAKALVRIARDKRCLTLVVDELLDLAPGLCDLLRGQGLCLLAGRALADFPDNPRELAALAGFDCCVATTPATSQALRRFGVVPLHEPAALDLRLKMDASAQQAGRTVSVLFLGAVWGENPSQGRLAALARLRSQGVPVLGLGDGFVLCEDFSGYARADLCGVEEPGGLENPVACLSQARIGLTFEDNQDVQSLHVLLAGALLVCPPTPFILQHFTPGRDLAVYSSLDELTDVCRHYLAHEDQRQSIASRGFEKAQRLFRHDRLLAALRTQTRRDQTHVGPLVARCRSYRARLTRILLDDDFARESGRQALEAAREALGVTVAGQALADCLALLPLRWRLEATARLERLLLWAVESKSLDLAQTLLPACLGSTACTSRTLILACALWVARRLGRTEGVLLDEYDRLQAALGSLADVTGRTRDAVFDDRFRKRKLVACTQAKGRVMLFGTGENGLAWAQWIARNLPQLPLAFVDNDQAKQSAGVDDYLVFPPKTLAGGDFACVLVTTGQSDAVERQLDSLGLAGRGDVVLTWGEPPLAHVLDDPD